MRCSDSKKDKVKKVKVITEHMNLSAYIRLTRIEHAFLLAIGVLVGIALSDPARLSDPFFILIAILPAVFVEISAFSINDYFDVETDRREGRLDRPLVSGEIPPNDALYLSIVTFILGSAIAFFINLPCFAITLILGLLAFLYSYKLKDLPLIGNTYIATAMAAPFVFGNLAVFPQPLTAPTVLALIAFITGLAREICGTLRDVEGDRKGRGARTFPMIVGKQMAALYASFLFFMAVLFSFFPLLFIPAYKNDINYLIPVLITDGMFMYVAYNLIWDQSKEFLWRARTITLMALAFGLVGFLAGALL